MFHQLVRVSVFLCTMVVRVRVGCGVVIVRVLVVVVNELGGRGKRGGLDKAGSHLRLRVRWVSCTQWSLMEESVGAKEYCESRFNARF